MALRVVLAEDNLVVREGLVSLLGGLEELSVIRACDSHDALLAAVDDLDPDVVLTDIRMPPTHSDEGIRAARRFRGSHPDVGVVVLSQHLDPAYALDLLDDGSRGRGYVLKDRVDDPGRLIDAITTVAKGGSYIDDEVVDVLVRSRRRAIGSPLGQLSRRECQVLTEMATGATNATIAARLHVTEHAVEKHTSSIFAKLGLTDEVEVNRRVSAVLMFLAGRRA